MADALRQSSQQANQMTAAALPYQREGGGANVVPAAMQGAQAMQGILLNQAEAEVRMRDVGIRHQLLNMELQTRSMLAPLQVQEAAARLETLKLNKQIQEFELGQQRMSYDMMPAIGTEESGYQVAVGPGRYEDADMSNPRHAMAVQRAQMASRGMEAQVAGAEAQVMRPYGTRDKRMDIVDDIQREKSGLDESLMRLYTELPERDKKGQSFEDWVETQRKAKNPTVTRRDQLTQEFDSIVGIGSQREPEQPALFRNPGTSTVALSFFKRAGISEGGARIAHDQLVLDARKKLMNSGMDPDDPRNIETAAMSLMTDPEYLEITRMEFNPPKMGSR